MIKVIESRYFSFLKIASIFLIVIGMLISYNQTGFWNPQAWAGMVLTFYGMIGYIVFEAYQKEKLK